MTWATVTCGGGMAAALVAASLRAQADRTVITPTNTERVIAGLKPAIAVIRVLGRLERPAVADSLAMRFVSVCRTELLVKTGCMKDSLSSLVHLSRGCAEPLGPWSSAQGGDSGVW